MKNQRGVADSIFLVIIGALLVLSWVSMLTGKNSGAKSVAKKQSFFETISKTVVPNRSGTSLGGSNQTGSEDLGNKSPWYGKISIYVGNVYAYQSSEEYIILQSNNYGNDESINITGWTLKNGAGDRKYQLNGSVIYGNSARVPIPQAALIYKLIPNNVLVPVILGPGDRAVVVTGSMPLVTKYPITSFRVNKCSGYMEDWESVNFKPSLSRSCPAPTSYSEVRNLDKKCYDFVSSLSYCHAPEFKDKVLPGGGVDSGAVDGVVGLSNDCKAFIQTHYSYDACVYNHINDKDFYKKEWRIYLGQPWEIWANERETITLYDSLGRIVNQITY